MIFIWRCPYRISLLGGSSDLDWWIDQGNEGLSLGFSINHYTHIVVAPSERGILKYSSLENYETIDLISHPLIREVLIELKQNQPIEMASFGSFQSGGGLGGSSSFLNCLIACILSLQGKKNFSNHEIANIACKIELENLKKPIGRQDQYLCALGGINFLKFPSNKKVCKEIELTSYQNQLLKNYLEDCLLVSTNMNRSTDKILNKVKGDNKSYSLINEIKKKAKVFRDSLESSKDVDFNLLESLIRDSWENKKNIQGVINNKLLILEQRLEKVGIHWIKLLGAGGGGSFLCKPKNKKELMDILIQENIKFNEFNIDNDGLKECKF